MPSTQSTITSYAAAGYPAVAIATADEDRTIANVLSKLNRPNAWRIALFGPPEEASWRRYVAEMARRYQGKIRLYEVGNEPDLGFWRGTTDEYERTLRAAYEEVHRADPQAQVLTGGFATVLEHQGRAQNHDLQERVLAEASDAFDIHAFHQHGPFKEFKTAVDGELARMRARMTHPRPLYFNETAISSAFIGEHEQAVTLVKKLSFAMARGATSACCGGLNNTAQYAQELTKWFDTNLKCA